MPAKKYIGKPCKHCGRVERYVSSRTCVYCTINRKLKGIYKHGKIIGGRKRCNECDIWKPFRLFHPNKSCLGGVTGTCRACNRDRINKWYKDNRAQRQERANYLNRKRKIEMVNRFGNKCHDCLGTFPMCVYDFHHLDNSDKDGNPSKFLSLSKTKREKELAKCILLCANCHRIRHFGKVDMTTRKEVKDVTE